MAAAPPVAWSEQFPCQSLGRERHGRTPRRGEIYAHRDAKLTWNAIGKTRVAVFKKRTATGVEMRVRIVGNRLEYVCDDIDKKEAP